MILAGDIGGTKTNLALFTKEDPHNYTHFASYPSQHYTNLNAILEEYLATLPEGIQIEAGCFAIAGPVIDGVCRVTNLPWIVTLQELKETTKIEKLFLINDLEANAHALEILSGDALLTLFAGEKSKGNYAVVSPGTGLGEAGVVKVGNQLHPFPSEGGHCDFGPTNEEQLEFCRYFHERFGHLSYDRILSGPGFVNIYNFFVEVKKSKEPEWLKREMGEKNHAAVITENALNGKSELCERVLDFYVEILGQEASNCALKFMATGGIYFGGGIPPKILPKLKGEGPLRKGFLNKGRFSSFLSKIPLYVILDDKASLKGAGHYARAAA